MLTKMTRQLFFLLFSLFLAPLCPARQDGLLPADEAGSMRPFDFSHVDTAAVWPDLRPVYVAHVARHGARYMTSAKKLEGLRHAIARSKEQGRLQRRGRDFEALLDTVAHRSHGRWGALSEVGCVEEHRLASQLHHLLPELLHGGSVNAISSYIPRVVRTMYEFCQPLTVLAPDISISTTEGKRYNYLVRCFSADTAYASYRKDGNWKAVYEKAVADFVPTEPAVRMLGGDSGFSEKELKDITLDIYDILQSLTAFGLEAPTTYFMKADEYHACWKVDNLAHYLRNTVTPLSSLAGRASTPLLLRIIADADAALAEQALQKAMLRADMTAETVNPCPANFYFGHAETLMPLLSLMRVQGCYTLTTDCDALAKSWKDYDVVPLGANLDIILLQAPSGEIHIALRHNGRFVAPMPGAPMLPRWGEYKSYLRKIVNSL